MCKHDKFLDQIVGLYQNKEKKLVVKLYLMLKKIGVVWVLITSFVFWLTGDKGKEASNGKTGKDASKGGASSSSKTTPAVLKLEG